MPKQNDRAGEMQESDEIGGAPFISRDEAAVVLQPGKEPFDLPATPIAAEGAAVLGQVDPVRAVRRDEFDFTGGESLIEPITVVRGIADEPLGIVGQKAGVQRLFDKLRFVRRRRGDGNGERKTSAVCNGHDLGPLAALGFADMASFFLALAKEPSMKVSLRSRPPRACRSVASALTTRRSVPF